MLELVASYPGDDNGREVLIVSGVTGILGGALDDTMCVGEPAMQARSGSLKPMTRTNITYLGFRTRWSWQINEWYDSDSPGTKEAPLLVFVL